MMLLAALLLAVPLTDQAELLWIDAGSDMGRVELRAGFLHSRDEQSPVPDPELVGNLKPEEWRLYKYNSFELAVYHGAGITYGLSDHYAWYKGGYPSADPWNNWAEYEAYILYVMQVYDGYFPDYPVEYYDIWNEPDHPYFWTGNYSQMLELFARAYHVIKTYRPDAKVVGPSISFFKPGSGGVKGIIDFLVDLDTQYGVRFDAISWHENGGTSADTRPDGIPARAQYLRDRIALYFPSSYTPDFHVSEFMGKQVHLSPGWNVGYLYYLEEAGVAKAMRACWSVYSLNPYDYWSDCWCGLNGLLMKEGETPTPAYWIWLLHAQMETEQRLEAASSDINHNVFATRDPSTNLIRLLTGRYLKSAPTEVYIRVEDYGYTHENVLVDIKRVPNFPVFYDDPPQIIPLPDGPIHVKSEILPVVNGFFQCTIEDYADGDAYVVTLVPPPSKPVVEGPLTAEPGVPNAYRIVTTNPDQSEVQYHIDWGDGTNTGWVGPVPPGFEVVLEHAWPDPGKFAIKGKARSVSGLESETSIPLRVMVLSLESLVRKIGKWFQKETGISLFKTH